ncbi:hypothetical protein Aperf_G00000004547 [Anoplocephala perfoliata]
MDLQKLIESVFPDRISKISCENKFLSSSCYTKEAELLRTVIDKLGRESAEAQSLPTAVTSSYKLQNSNYRCYILSCSDVNDSSFGECFEVEPLCVLDFYISTNYQRRGYGRELFEFMLREEKLEATDLPLDSPSQKMLAFMRKHYNQDHPLRQSNSFVVFPSFFLHVNQFLVPRRRLAKSIIPPNALTRQCSSVSDDHSVQLKAGITHGNSGALMTTDFSSQITHQPSEWLPLGSDPDQSSMREDEAFPKANIDVSSKSIGDLDQFRRTAHSPQLKIRPNCDSLTQGPPVHYAKRLDAAPQSNLLQSRLGLSNSKIDSALRWNERKAGYDY